VSCRALWLTCCVGLLAAASPATAKGKIVSHWLDREIVIDGELDEWRDALVYFASVDAFVGVFNDGSNLYLCLYSRNPEVSNQLAVDGVRLRFEGKNTDAFAVNFPRASGRDDPRARGRRGETDRTPAATDSIALELPGQRDPVTVSAGGEAGLEARVSHRGSFVYELKVPLVAGDGQPWAPGLFPGDKFKLLIENPRIDAMADEAAAQGRHRGTDSPFQPGTSGSYGGRNDPGWTGGVGMDEPFLGGGFAFLLKIRVELAKAP
jgi:hypothetical protein